MVKGNDSRFSIDVLRTAVIYGANASGKSNLIKAMQVAKLMLTGSFAPGKPLPYTPFRLDAEMLKKPTRFEFDIKIGDRIFTYGFEFTRYRIRKEWLTEQKKTTEKNIYLRTTSVKGDVDVTYNPGITKIGSKTAAFYQFAQDATRPEQLLLRKLAENNDEFFQSVYNWFDDQLTLVFPESKFGLLEFHIKNNIDFKERFSAFLRGFDTGISGIECTETDIEKIPDLPSIVIEDIVHSFEENQISIVPSSSGLRYIFEMEKGKIKAYKLTTIHKTRENKDIFFEISEESDGTQRMMDLIPLLFSLMKGGVCVIDEIDRSLHPKLVRQFFEYFLNHSDFAQGQLIATTHDVMQMSTHLFRRDEIWLTEKTEFGESRLFSVADFKLKHDKDIRKAYLDGLLGGVPFSSAFSSTIMN
ncbi:MAG: ATP-binding protein [Bacteroidia bacterium]|nr:ATP-binding protein [Bacteroidia bacterium]